MVANAMAIAIRELELGPTGTSQGSVSCWRPSWARPTRTWLSCGADCAATCGQATSRRPANPSCATCSSSWATHRLAISNPDYGRTRG